MLNHKWSAPDDDGVRTCARCGLSKRLRARAKQTTEYRDPLAVEWTAPREVPVCLTALADEGSSR